MSFNFKIFEERSNTQKTINGNQKRNPVHEDRIKLDADILRITTTLYAVRITAFGLPTCADRVGCYIA